MVVGPLILVLLTVGAIVIFTVARASRGPSIRPGNYINDLLRRKRSPGAT